MLKKVAIRSAMALVVSTSLITSALASDTIKIGTFLAVTGPASFLGYPELKTLQMYVEKLNAEGGLLGKKVELIHYDSTGNAQKARTFVKRLIDVDKVDLIIGGSTSGTSLAVIPIVQSAQVPFISLAAAVAIVEPVKKWVFKTPHTDRMAVEKIFEDMRARGYKKIALISGTGGFGRSGRAQAMQVIGKYDLELVASEVYGPKDTDVSAQLRKIKAIEGVDAVLNFGFGQGPVMVTKNYKRMDVGLPLYQSHGVASQQFIELTGEASEGVRLPAAALLVAEQLPDGNLQKPVVLKYKTEYEQKYNSEVSTFGGHAYDGLMLAVNAIKTAGSIDKEKVRAAIESTRNYVGTGGVVNMSAENHLGLDLSAFKMLEIRKGGWVLSE